MARLRRAGCEAVGLDGVSPALRAWASNFSLRGQRKVTKRKATPANPTATRFLSDKVQGRTDRRRRHIPVPAASAPSSLMALLTLPLPLGGLEGDQDRVRHSLWGNPYHSSHCSQVCYVTGISDCPHFFQVQPQPIFVVGWC